MSKQRKITREIYKVIKELKRQGFSQESIKQSIAMEFDVMISLSTISRVVHSRSRKAYFDEMWQRAYAHKAGFELSPVTKEAEVAKETTDGKLQMLIEEVRRLADKIEHIRYWN